MSNHQASEGAADGGADRRARRRGGESLSPDAVPFTSSQSNIVTEKGKFKWEDIGLTGLCFVLFFCWRDARSPVASRSPPL